MDGWMDGWMDVGMPDLSSSDWVHFTVLRCIIVYVYCHCICVL